jgi:transcription elongation factor B subunit 1
VTPCSGVILLKIIEYLAYKVQYADFNTVDIIEDFSDRIDPYITLELCVSSAVVRCQSLTP